MADVQAPAGAPRPVPPDVRHELADLGQEWYDLQPVEKKLVKYSLGVGIVLLAVFIVVFGVFN